MSIFLVAEALVETDFPSNLSWNPVDQIAAVISSPVDENDNFKPNFYIVPKEHVISKGFLTLTAMNGTSDANLYNQVVPMSTNVRYDDADWYFSRGNILSGTTYKHLMKFLKTKKVKSISNK